MEKDARSTQPSPPRSSASLEEGGTKEVINYLKGWRLHLVTVAICLSLFLANFEITIVSTSLVAIADDLQGYNKSSWIVNAYLTIYTGFLIIWAKMSDIFGRKLSVTTSVFIFLVFSGACGAAQTTTQLIVFRAFQGFGGSGIYALGMVIFFELVPPELFASYTSMVSAVFALSLLLGPLLGGLINNSTNWRWVFLLNVPAGFVAMAVLMVAIPANFPHQGQTSYETLKMGQVFTKKALKRVDWFGATLLLAASLLLVTALEEAGIRYPWRSALVITFLVVSGILWITFVAWEHRVTRAASAQEPVFPWRFFQSRVRIGMILSTFLVGAPFTVAVIQIPQRFQAVNGTTPLGAGVRLLPFAFASPVGSFVSSIIAGKAKVPPIYLILVGAVLQVVGYALLSTISTGSEIQPAQYGYEVITGLGVGVNISTLILMTPFTIEKRDQSVAMGAVVQFRVMGGAIGLAIVTSVMNSFVKSRLAEILSADQIEAFLQSISMIGTLPPALAEMVRSVLGEGYNLQMKVLIGFAAAQIPAILLMWQKKQILV